MKRVFGHASHVGRQRDHNEDRYGCDPDLGVWIVADGMGGYDAGEVASAIAVETVLHDLRNGVPLREAVLGAHRTILDAPQDGRGMSGMGTTIVALQMRGARYEIVWVGDSRAYLLGGRLHQLTRDHSLVQQLLDNGAITRHEAATHPQRNVITQALGSHAGRDLRVETVTGVLHRGESILLCSDGLYGEVGDQDLDRIVATSTSAQDAVDALIEAANNHGGSDNITAVLVEAPPDAPVRRRSVSDTVPYDSRAFRKYVRRRKVLFGVLLLLLLIAGASLLWWLWPAAPPVPLES